MYIASLIFTWNFVAAESKMVKHSAERSYNIPLKPVDAWKRESFCRKTNLPYAREKWQLVLPM